MARNRQSLLSKNLARQTTAASRQNSATAARPLLPREIDLGSCCWIQFSRRARVLLGLLLLLRLAARSRLTIWSWRRDLNPRPSDYKSDALPAELRQRASLLGHHAPNKHEFSLPAGTNIKANTTAIPLATDVPSANTQHSTLQGTATRNSPLPRACWLGILQSAPAIGRRYKAVISILTNFLDLTNAARFSRMIDVSSMRSRRRKLWIALAVILVRRRNRCRPPAAQARCSRCRPPSAQRGRRPLRQSRTRPSAHRPGQEAAQEPRAANTRNSFARPASSSSAISTAPLSPFTTAQTPGNPASETRYSEILQGHFDHQRVSQYLRKLSKKRRALQRFRHLRHPAGRPHPARGAAGHRYRSGLQHRRQRRHSRHDRPLQASGPAFCRAGAGAATITAAFRWAAWSGPSPAFPPTARRRTAANCCFPEAGAACCRAAAS